MKTTEEEWAGSFGDAYHARNWVDWQLRIPFWQHIIELTGARSVFEFGCGPGWNLSAIRRSYPADVSLQGYEINSEAAQQALSAQIDVLYPGERMASSDLVFTAGCLIHIPPADIHPTMDSLIAQSYRYVMSIEYEAEQETEIEYRGQMGLLWKRPYAEMYEAKGLTLIDRGKLHQDAGFDNCTYALFTK